MTEKEREEVLDAQGNKTQLRGLAGHQGDEREPVPEDLEQKNKKDEPFYGKTTDPEALYDKRRIIEEG